MNPINQIKLDERNHVEIPLLKQLQELGWEIIDLADEREIRNQTPDNTYRENFTEVVMLPVLRESLQKINPWNGRRSS